MLPTTIVRKYLFVISFTGLAAKIAKPFIPLSLLRGGGGGGGGRNEGGRCCM